MLKEEYLAGRRRQRLLASEPGGACGNSDTGDTPADDGKITLGFSQVGAESGWRTANTNSIKDVRRRRPASS